MVLPRRQNYHVLLATPADPNRNPLPGSLAAP